MRGTVAQKLVRPDHRPPYRGAPAIHADGTQFPAELTIDKSDDRGLFTLYRIHS